MWMATISICNYFIKAHGILRAAVEQCVLAEKNAHILGFYFLTI